jgi:ParB family transcriptional regulator, chromosome partitioning protein
MPTAPRKAGLGRGLSALIPGGAQQLEEIPVSAIRPNPNQPRASFDEESLASLTESVRSVGVLQPVLVRPVGAAYEMIAGERRLRAAQRAGLSTVPAMIRETEDASSLEQALIENLHREDLNPLEEAAAFQQLIEDFGLTHDDVGRKVGRSRSAVTNSLRLLSLPGQVQAHLASGALAAGHARALLSLAPDEQVALAQVVVRDGLSVRATEEAVARRLQGAPEPDTRRGRAPGYSPALLEVEGSLSDYLDTRVRIQPGARKGRIVVEYGSMEDLARLWRLIVGHQARL